MLYSYTTKLSRGEFVRLALRPPCCCINYWIIFFHVTPIYLGGSSVGWGSWGNNNQGGGNGGWGRPSTWGSSHHGGGGRPGSSGSNHHGGGHGGWRRPGGWGVGGGRRPGFFGRWKYERKSKYISEIKKKWINVFFWYFGCYIVHPRGRKNKK